MLRTMIRENLSDKVIFEWIFEDGKGSCVECRAEHGTLDAWQIYMGGVEWGVGNKVERYEVCVGGVDIT